MKIKTFLNEMLILSVATVILLIGLRLGFGQTDEHYTTSSEPHDILLADHLHGQWLTIARVNHKEPGSEFNPNWTYIKVEAPIIPVVKKRGQTYYIEFTSDLTKDLP